MDDGSTRHPSCFGQRPLDNAPGFEQSRSRVVSGIRPHSIHMTFDAVVVMDGDLQDVPEAIPHLVEVFQ